MDGLYSSFKDFLLKCLNCGPDGPDHQDQNGDQNQDQDQDHDHQDSNDKKPKVDPPSTRKVRINNGKQDPQKQASVRTSSSLGHLASSSSSCHNQLQQQQHDSSAPASDVLVTFSPSYLNQHGQANDHKQLNTCHDQVVTSLAYLSKADD